MVLLVFNYLESCLQNRLRNWLPDDFLDQEGRQC